MGYIAHSRPAHSRGAYPTAMISTRMGGSQWWKKKRLWCARSSPMWPPALPSTLKHSDSTPRACHHPGASTAAKRESLAVGGHTTVRKIVGRTAYSGTHTVSTSKGPIEREVPTIIEPEAQQKALETLADNKRYHSRPTDRKYLLRGLIRCGVCGLHYVGHPAHCRGEKRYYYTCSRKHREHYAKSGERCSSPYVRAGWIEDLVWQDVREFLRNPGEVLQRIR